MASSLQSALLKREIEAKLASRIPAALSPQAIQAPRLVSSGVSEIDGLLGGGLPIGGVTEFTGMASSGRTSLAFALLAEATAESACAYIDVDDTMDPKSTAASGVDHKNLLWVRVGSAGIRPAAASTPRGPISEVRLAGAGKMAGGHCGSRHPRTETRGLDAALGKMLTQKSEARLAKMEGTPGHPNRKLSLAAAPEEQVAFEHFNARHADASDPIRQADRRAANEAHERAKAPLLVSPATKSRKSRGIGWTKRSARPIRSFNQAASVLLCSISPPYHPSRHFASLRQPGSASGEPLRRVMRSSSC